MADWKVTISGPAEVSHVNEIHTEERKVDKSLDRRNVNVLLELSEEEVMKDLEPQEYRGYQGWEEAVCGWGRVAPLAAILLAEKTGHKLKRKDTENNSTPTPGPDAFSELSNDEQSRPLTTSSSASSQHMWTNTQSGLSNTPSDSPETIIMEDMSKTISQLVLKSQTEDASTACQSKQMVSKWPESRSQKAQKHSQRTASAIVPIKNFTFLPPIAIPFSQQNPTGKRQVCEESFLMIQKINKSRRTKGDLDCHERSHNEAMSSKYRTFQQNPNCVSAVSVSVPRYHMAMSSKPETLHPTGYKVIKTFRTNAANTQGHIHPGYLYSS